MNEGARLRSDCNRSGRSMPSRRTSARIIETKSTSTVPLPDAAISTEASVSRTGLVNENRASCHPAPAIASAVDAMASPFARTTRSVNSGAPCSRRTHAHPSYVCPLSTKIRPCRMPVRPRSARSRTLFLPFENSTSAVSTAPRSASELQYVSKSVPSKPAPRICSANRPSSTE
jgi:hypothetical protein